MSENKIKEKESNLDSLFKGDTVEEKLQNLEENLTIEFYRGLIEANYEKIESLQEIIDKLRQNEITLRDEIAMKCFIAQYKDVSTISAAVEEAYRAADIFLGVRNEGLIAHEFTTNPNILTDENK